MTDRVIATVHSYDQLIEAMRLRAAELRVSGGQIEMGAGLPAGYVSKLLAPVPIKGLGRSSLGPMLWMLGIKIIVTEDPVAFAKFTAELKRKKDQYAASGMQPRNTQSNRGNSEWGKIMNCRRMILQTPTQRKRLAKRAAQARWRKQSGSGRGDSSS